MCCGIIEERILLESEYVLYSSKNEELLDENIFKPKEHVKSGNGYKIYLKKKIVVANPILTYKCVQCAYTIQTSSKCESCESGEADIYGLMSPFRGFEDSLDLWECRVCDNKVPLNLNCSFCETMNTWQQFDKPKNYSVTTLSPSVLHTFDDGVVFIEPATEKKTLIPDWRFQEKQKFQCKTHLYEEFPRVLIDLVLNYAFGDIRYKIMEPFKTNFKTIEPLKIYPRVCEPF